MQTVKKVKRSVSGRSFKLTDFHFYDQRKEVDNDGTNGNSSSNTSDESSVSSGYGNSGQENYQDPSSSPDQPKFIIQMFGLNDKGETCCIFVSNYSPFFYVRIGDDWKKNDVNALLREIKSRLASVRRRRRPSRSTSRYG